MQLQLDSAEKLRANWKFLTPEQIGELVASEVVSIAFRAAINSSVDWRVYTGRVDVGAYYRAYGEYIADVVGYQTVAITPEVAQGVALYIMSQVPQIATLMIEANGGNMPPILPPVKPEPSNVDE